MNNQKPSPKRHVLAAWLVGGFIYMLLALEVVAEAGAIAIPFQLVMGAGFSIVFVGVAALLGFLLRAPVLRQLWYSSAFASVVMLVGAVVLIFFGHSFGLTTILHSTDTDSTYEALHPAVACGSMLAAVFATLHFSTGRPSTSE